ncbi:MAG: zinc ABC transporter substrate-binding protein [Sphingobacteriaceae bacterium]|nr:zinc ABC transporter substrate-binding protein [Sphingobacteriaceae bacterium]
MQGRSTLFFLLLMVGVLSSSSTAAQAPVVKVVATTSFLADMAQQLAGEHCEVISLLPLGADPHIYEAVPGDARLLAEADLIIENGLNLEGWLKKLIDQAGGKALLVTASDGITPIGSAEHANSYDPHAWMDPLLGRIYIRNMANGLQRLLPAHAADIERNFEAYDQQLLSLHTYIEGRIAQIPAEHRIIATTHDAFRYFGNRYGMRVLSVLGTTTDAEVRVSDLHDLIRTIEAENLPALFIESTINPKLLQQVAADAGIRIGGSMYADSMGPKGSGADTYLSMLRHNADTLLEGLQGSGAANSRRTDLLMLLIIAGFFALAFAVLAVRIQRKNSSDLPAQHPIHINGLTVAYDDKVILNHFDLQLEQGKLYGLIGPNGSGKSTLFKSILGLLKTDRGAITIGGLPVEAVQTHIAYVPQKEEIDWTFPATVYDLVLMGRYPHKRPFQSLNSTDKAKALQHIQELELEQLLHKQIGELSGGQQQRVFLARALAQEAQLYFLDEPFVGVDVTTEEKIIQILRRLVAEGKTVVMIHHDLSKAQAYFDQVIMINRRLVAFGSPAEVVTEANILRTFSGTQPMYDQAQQFNRSR